ncbi:MAG: phosphoribosyl-ATP diphosphatase [Betaproteobacteria bacterium]|nr:MAG: phosphoribosyl-ATP diphosphatase [Betaproteobacteria bacterium]
MRSTVNASSTDVLARLSATIAARKEGDPNSSYTAKLFAKGEDAALKKVGEEAAEFIMAAKDAGHGGDVDKLVGEAADVWFHMLVALARHNVGAVEVAAELARREGLSGLEEKAARP